MSLGKKKPPRAPNYTNLAEQTAAANADAIRDQVGLNRPGEENSFGSRSWSLRPGADPNNPKPNDWVVSDRLNEGQQHLFDQREGLQRSFGEAAQGMLPRMMQSLNSSIDPNGLPKRSNFDFSAVTDRKAAEDNAYANITKRYDQRFNSDEASLRTRLANTGLMEGSEAYNSALKSFGQEKSDAYGQASRDAYTAGGQEQSRAMQDMLQAMQGEEAQRGSALNEQITLRDMPMRDMANILPYVGAQGQAGGAQFAQAGVAPGADYSTAGQQQFQANMDRVNAQNAGISNLMNAGAQVGAAYAGRSSDIRLKTDISRVGTHKELGIGIFDFTIRGERQRGVMAQDVLQVRPEAVFTTPDGYYAVDYRMLGEAE